MFVYLPTRDNLLGGRRDVLRTSFVRSLQSAGVAAVDLVAEFPMMDESDLDRIFIKPGEIDFYGAEGHYTEAGNRLVARLVFEALKLLSPGAKQLGEGR